MVTIKYYGVIRNMTGKEQEELHSGTISQLLKQIKETYGPELYKLAKSSHIVVNGISVARNGGFRYRTQDGDVVKLFPVSAGG